MSSRFHPSHDKSKTFLIFLTQHRYGVVLDFSISMKSAIPASENRSGREKAKRAKRAKKNENVAASRPPLHESLPPGLAPMISLAA